MFRAMHTPAALAVLVLAGCGGDGLTGLPDAVVPEGIVFEATDTVWAHGDTITILLANDSDETLGYDFCPAVLQRWTDGSWKAVKTYPTDYVFCFGETHLLEPGQSVFAEIVAYEFMEPGAYRFPTRIEWPMLPQGGQTEIFSSGFRITRK